jgi:hypothetical protein
LAFSRAALRRRLQRQLAEQLVVLRVGTDPEPDQTVGRFDGKRTMMRANAG